MTPSRFPIKAWILDFHNSQFCGISQSEGVFPVHSVNSLSTMMRNFCILLCLCNAALSSPIVSSDEELHNPEVSIDSAPYQLSLRVNGTHRCGAVLVSSQQALTAAHCVVAVEKNPDLISLVAGSDDLRVNGQSRNVQKVTAHPGYNLRSHDNDVAVLELKTPYDPTPSVAPVKLVPKGFDLSKLTKASISGFGFTSRTAYKLSNKLRKVTVTLIPRDTCQSLYPGLITDNMLCAGELDGSKDACIGDAGGPLVSEDPASKEQILVGIISWGKDCGSPNSPGVYANVEVLRDWISQQADLD